MNIKTQLLSLIIGLLNLILLGLIPYTYLQKQEVQDNKINTEIEDRKTAISNISIELDKKVDINTFTEFKDGYDKILEYMESSGDREDDYLRILMKLSYFDLDTSIIQYNNIVIK